MNTHIPKTVKPTINYQRGVENLGGDEEMYNMMLERFEELSLDQVMESVFVVVDKMDFRGIYREMDTLKGPLRLF